MKKWGLLLGLTFLWGQVAFAQVVPGSTVPETSKSSLSVPPIIYPNLNVQTFNVIEQTTFLSDNQKAAINKRAFDVITAKQIDLKLVILPSLKQMNAPKLSFDEYSVKLFEHWNTTSQSPMDKVMVAYSVPQKKVYITGTEEWNKKNKETINTLYKSYFYPKIEAGAPQKGVTRGTMKTLYFLQNGTLSGGILKWLLLLIIIGFGAYAYKQHKNTNGAWTEELKTKLKRLVKR